MEDQVISLQKRGINVAMLNASATKEHVKYVHDQMIKSNPELKILYVTPEKLAKSKRFLAKLEKAYASNF